jgi:hypothetical protein
MPKLRRPWAAALIWTWSKRGNVFGGIQETVPVRTVFPSLWPVSGKRLCDRRLPLVSTEIGGGQGIDSGRFTSLPCAHDLGGENPNIDTKDVLKLLNCGRLGRQAAGHPWSALRVMKSCRKTAQQPRCCSKPKQQLCIQNGTRAHYLRLKTDRQVETRPMSAGTQADRAAS